MASDIILVGSLLLFISIFVGRLGYRFGIPMLLLFLIIGMLFGSDGLGIEFYDARVAQWVGILALSVILFTGGMETSYRQIKPIVKQGMVLSTVGVLLTAIITGLFIYKLSWLPAVGLNLSLPLSLLLASTMSSTDSASVFNILRSQKTGLKNNLRPTLELESGSNDPMAYMLTIALIQYLTSGDMNNWAVAGNFVLQFVIGGAMGWIVGKLVTMFVKKYKIASPTLHSLMLLSLVFFTFSMTDILHGNGYLSVYIAGLMIGNSPMSHKRETNTLFDGISTLAQIVMFLSLGLLVNPHEMFDVVPAALIIGVFLMLLARPVAVFLCLWPFRSMNWRSKTFVSWVGLRGAVPIIFATYPVVAGVQNSQHIFNIVFVITLLSLVVQGMTVTPLARLLKLDEPMPVDQSNFGVEVPDELNVNVSEVVLSKDRLKHGNRLKEMSIPKGRLVIMVKRGDDFLVPDGSMLLNEGDRLLVITKQNVEATLSNDHKTIVVRERDDTLSS